MGHSVESTVSGVRRLVSDSGPLRICCVISRKSPPSPSLLLYLQHEGIGLDTFWLRCCATKREEERKGAQGGAVTVAEIILGR